MINRDEFRRLAIALHEKRHGVTVCAPGPAIGAQLFGQRVGRRAHGRHFVTHVAHRIIEHPHDESGEAQPIRRQLLTGRSRQKQGARS